MRAKMVMVCLCCVAIVFLVLSSASSFLSPNLILEEERLARDWLPAAVRTEVKGFGVHLGDIIVYKIKIFYQPNKAEINKKSLAENVIFEPFEIRDVKEKEFNLSPDGSERLYEREYEIQLIDGRTNFLYSFPAIEVEFKGNNSGGSFKEKVTPEPIFIVPWVPPGANDFELRPLKGAVKNVDYQRIPWILWGLGGLFSVAACAEIIKRVQEIKKAGKAEKKTIEGLGDIFDLYRTLEVQLQTEDPRAFFHRIYQILRMVLDTQEGINLSNKSDLAKIPEEKRKLITGLSKRCQAAYGPETVSEEAALKAMDELKKILSLCLDREGGA